jgi:hypothetical protein
MVEWRLALGSVQSIYTSIIEYCRSCMTYVIYIVKYLHVRKAQQAFLSRCPKHQPSNMWDYLIRAILYLLFAQTC